MMDKKVVIVQTSDSKNPLILTFRTITPKVMSMFKWQCLHHFIIKKVDKNKNKQVLTIAANFQDELIQT